MGTDTSGRVHPRSRGNDIIYISRRRRRRRATIAIGRIQRRGWKSCHVARGYTPGRTRGELGLVLLAPAHGERELPLLHLPFSIVHGCDTGPYGNRGSCVSEIAWVIPRRSSARIGVERLPEGRLVLRAMMPCDSFSHNRSSVQVALNVSLAKQNVIVTL